MSHLPRIHADFHGCASPQPNIHYLSKNALSAFIRANPWLKALFITLVMLFSASAIAQVKGNVAPPEFRDDFEEARFRDLTHQLRCVMCQNQSLADSDAEIARDLRNELLVLMRQGKTDTEIRDFMVERYGEFVLYKPRLESHTALLWLGPAALVLIGGVLVFLLVRRHGGRQSAIPVDDKQEW